jgi:hypothetical protein
MTSTDPRRTMTSTVRTRPRVIRTAAATCAAALLLLGAAACGSAANNGATSGPNSEGGQQGGPQGGPQDQRAGGGMPGAFGKVAAVTDHVAQVQGMQGQVAVSWTAATTFTKDVAATLSDVKVGTCVLVLPSSKDTSDQGTSGNSSGGGTPPTAVTAASVRITQPTGGSCSPTRGPGGGDGPQLQGAPPSGGVPSGAPQGGQRPQVRGLGGAAGKVTAVSAAGFTVASAMPGSSSPTPVTVTVGATTTYTTTAQGAASDVKVGVCVQAQGSADDTGAVTATRIAVSMPQDGQCGGMVRMRSSAGDGTTSQGS